MIQNPQMRVFVSFSARTESHFFKFWDWNQLCVWIYETPRILPAGISHQEEGSYREGFEGSESFLDLGTGPVQIRFDFFVDFSPYQEPDYRWRPRPQRDGWRPDDPTMEADWRAARCRWSVPRAVGAGTRRRCWSLPTFSLLSKSYPEDLWFSWHNLISSLFYFAYALKWCWSKILYERIGKILPKLMLQIIEYLYL